MKESVIAPLLPPLLVQPYHPRLQPPQNLRTNRQCYNGPPLQLDELASPTATTTNTTSSIVNMIRNSSSEEEDNSNTHNNNVVSTVENSSPKSQHDQPTTNTTSTTTTRGYTDHAQEVDPTERIQATYGNQSMSIIQHEDETTRSLAIQKLPSKLAAMLSDPDLITCITWLPHGRSWKILNRDLFSSYALPRYFGHTNHSSFVRVVNAWGFRRIVSGPDRDSYYHELFLRGKPNLYARMRRLGNSSGGGGGRSGGKREEVEVDFYELAKTSPLPENMWRYRPQAMNNGGVGSGRMGTSGAGGGGASAGQMSSFGGMSAAMAQGMMSGMMGGAAGTMGMYPSAMSSASAYGTGASSMTNPMMGGYSGSSGWNPTATTTSGTTTTTTGSTASMMGMPSSMTSRQMSFDGSTTTTSASARVPQDSSTNRMSTTNTNMPQLLAALRQDPSQTATAATTNTTTNTTSSNTTTNNSSEEMERLMNQNQLLKALLKRTQEAVAASRMKDGSS